MSGLFNIPIRGIKEGHHNLKYEIGKQFFDLFEESEIKEGDLIAVAEIEKTYSHIDLDIKISGNVRICCDRCLEMFDHPVNCENRLLLKFGNELDDSNPEIITLPRDEHEMDLKQCFYEFIYLSLPIQRIHPDDAQGISTCNPEMMQKLKEHLVKEENKNDSRWEELERLINDN